jgi:hypothetical protein
MQGPSGVVGDVFGSGGVFDLHVAKFLRVEDLATLKALNELVVFMPGNDPDPGMSAGGGHGDLGLAARSQSGGEIPLTDAAGCDPRRRPMQRSGFEAGESRLGGLV